MITPGTSPRFGELTIKGFRRLRDVRMELRPVSVLIGANGSGKTSVLDVLGLLAQSAEGKLAGAISELSGIGSVLTNEQAPALELGITSTASGQLLAYDLLLRAQRVGYVISSETFIQKVSIGDVSPTLHISSRDSTPVYHEALQANEPDWLSYDHAETALSQVPKMLRIPEAFRRRLGFAAHYHSLDVGRRSLVRLPQSLGPAILPGKNGEDLVSCLFNLRETQRDRFAALEDSLQAAYPRFDGLAFPTVAAGTIVLGWRERGVAKPFYAHQLSEGTLRYLWLTALLQSPGLTALTLIDEPEVSLHPELLSLLADQLREASQRTQIVVATQSDTLIRFLEAKEVVVLDSDEDGMTTLTRADELDLDDWLRDYSLDELWRNGRLGARA